MKPEDAFTKAQDIQKEVNKIKTSANELIKAINNGTSTDSTKLTLTQQKPMVMTQKLTAKQKLMIKLRQMAKMKNKVHLLTKQNHKFS